MENKVIGRFSAKTFNNHFLEFEVREDGFIYWNHIKDEKIKRLIIKPKLEIYLQNGTSYALNNRSSIELIESYFIEPKLLEYLIKNHRVMYSTDMAYLYGFDKNYAYDFYDQARAFKWVRNKEKILTKQKQGIFN